MERLNYFNRYDSKDAHHEDQLTRAYLVLLKHSVHAFFTFFEYCRDKLKLEDGELSPSFLEYIDNDWTIDTQKSNPNIGTYYLWSVLITDEKISNDSSISPSDRNARYDGIITFGHRLTMIIENKPESNNVWPDQLNPSKQNLSGDVIIYKNPTILEWKEIIKHLNSLLSVSTISGYEKIMINDFLSFVDEKFTHLNPYDNFSLCKNNESLLYRRIENILKSIVFDPMTIKRHRGWGYYIDVPFEQIKQIGLILNKNQEDWKLELSLCFGDSQQQAKGFYSSTINISKLKELNDWNSSANFHVSFSSSNLVWFESNIDKYKYIEYWIKNIGLIYQRKKNEVEPYLETLEKDDIIIYNFDKQKEMDDKYFSTNMQTLNICPGFAMTFNISSKDAMEKDKTKELEKLISEKIKEGLSIANLEWKEILK